MAGCPIALQLTAGKTRIAGEFSWHINHGKQ
jgi:hypothetical protein